MDQFLLVFVCIWASYYAYVTLIIGKVPARIRMQQAIESGIAPLPYRDRLLYPYVSLVLKTVVRKYEIAWMLINSVLVSGLIYAIYLVSGIFGATVFVVLMPVIITGYWMEGDFIIALLLCLVILHPEFVVLYVIIGLLERREQTALIVVVAAISGADTWALMAASVWYVVWNTLAYIRSRHLHTPYTVQHHLNNNLNSKYTPAISRMWAVTVLPFVVFVLLHRDQLSVADKWIYATMIPYTLMFLFKGNMWEMGKYIPFWIIVTYILGHITY